MGEIVRVNRASSAIAVDLDGAHITELILDGRQVFFSGEEEGKRRTSHVTWPYFSDAETSGLPKEWPKHGFARRTLWRQTHTDDERLAIKLEMEHSDEMRAAGIPEEVKLEMSLQITNHTFNWDVTSSNSGKEAFSERFGFHPYFRVAGTFLSDYLDSLGVAPENPLSGKPVRTDNPGVFEAALPGLGFVTVHGDDPTDLPDIILWTSRWGAGYFCIEPCRTGLHPPLALYQGQSRHYRVRIEVEE